MNVLIIEDEERVVSLVRTCIEADGHICKVAHSGEQGLVLFQQHLPDAVILDIGLPDISGLDVCTRMRQMQHLKDPVILMLTARKAEVDRIIGYASGADDYIEKPFSPQELPVRLRAVARRAQHNSTPNYSTTQPTAVQAKLIQTTYLHIDPEKRQVVVEHPATGHKSKCFNLSSLEFELLYLLASRPGRVWSRSELLNEVRGMDFVGDERSIDSCIKRIRSKIKATGKPVEFIKTHVSLGYSFEEH
jgi:two-component system OmpR family response regulator